MGRALCLSRGGEGRSEDKERLSSAEAYAPFLKSFSNEPLCSTRDAFGKEMANAGLDKLASLIKTHGLLMQQKSTCSGRRHHGTANVREDAPRMSDGSLH